MRKESEQALEIDIEHNISQEPEEYAKTSYVRESALSGDRIQ